MMLLRARSTHLPLLVGMARTYCELDQHPFEEQKVRAGFGALLESDRHGVVWLIGAGVAGDPVGYAVVTWGWSVEGGGPEALLDEFFVDDRGRGIGSEALDSIIEDCRNRGMRRIFLETEDHNDRARRFYRRRGFVDEASVWMSLTLED